MVSSAVFSPLTKTTLKRGLSWPGCPHRVTSQILGPVQVKDTRSGGPFIVLIGFLLSGVSRQACWKLRTIGSLRKKEPRTSPEPHSLTLPNVGRALDRPERPRTAPEDLRFHGLQLLRGRHRGPRGGLLQGAELCGAGSGGKSSLVPFQEVLRVQVAEMETSRLVAGGDLMESADILVRSKSLGRVVY